MQMSVDPPAPPRRAESPAPVRQGLKSQTSNRQRPDRWIKPDTRVSRLNCQVNFDGRLGVFYRRRSTNIFVYFCV